MIHAFVNTLDLEGGTDELANPNRLSEWLVALGLMEPGQLANPDDLKNAIAVREAMRGMIGANSGAGLFPMDIATLNKAVVASRLRARFGSDGKTRLEPEAAGVEGALGRIVGAVFAAMGEEDWSRLKVCASRSCRRVFYDQSRNRSSRWCRMASCGNRQKAKRFRERVKAS